MVNNGDFVRDILAGSSLHYKLSPSAIMSGTPFTEWTGLHDTQRPQPNKGHRLRADIAVSRRAYAWVNLHSLRLLFFPSCFCVISRAHYVHANVTIANLLFHPAQREIGCPTAQATEIGL